MDMLAKVAKVNQIKTLGKILVSLTIEQLEILIALLSCHKEKKMPTKKGVLVFHLVK